MFRIIFGNIREFVHGVSSISVVISGLLILILMLMMVIEVVCRYGFNNPTTWVAELSSYVMVYLVSLAIGYALLVDRHVRVDLVVNRLPHRVQCWFNLIAAVAAFFFASVLTWRTGELFLTVYSQSWRSAAELCGLWLWPFYLVLPVGFLLLTAVSVCKIWHWSRATLDKPERRT